MDQDVKNVEKTETLVCKKNPRYRKNDTDSGVCFRFLILAIDVIENTVFARD